MTTQTRPNRIALPGVQHRVTVTYDPDLPTRGRTDWHPTRITLREPNPGVLLHEVLHVLVAHAPETPLPPGHANHEAFVRFITAGLGAYLGIDLPPHSSLAAAPAPTDLQAENERLRAEVHDLTGQVLYRTWMHDGPVAPPAPVTPAPPDTTTKEN